MSTEQKTVFIVTIPSCTLVEHVGGDGAGFLSLAEAKQWLFDKASEAYADGCYESGASYKAGSLRWASDREDGWNHDRLEVQSYGGYWHPVGIVTEVPMMG